MNYELRITNYKCGMTLVEVMVGIAILVVAMYLLTQLIYNLSTLQFEVRSRLCAQLECVEAVEKIYASQEENGNLESVFGVTTETFTDFPAEKLIKVTVKRAFAIYTDASKSYSESLSFIRYSPEG